MLPALQVRHTGFGCSQATEFLAIVGVAPLPMRAIVRLAPRWLAPNEKIATLLPDPPEPEHIRQVREILWHPSECVRLSQEADSQIRKAEDAPLL